MTRRIIQVAAFRPHRVPKLASHRIITPNPRAAAALEAPPVSLVRLGHEVLRSKGWSDAHALLAHRYLIEAAKETLQSTDPEGMAAAMAPTLRALLRSGADLPKLADSASARARRIARLAIAYRQRLAAQHLVDSGELLWKAIELSSTPQLLTIYGYPRLGPDEQAFIEAIAADGSLLLLPCGAEPHFSEPCEAAGWFQERGWSLELEPEAEGKGLPTPCFGRVAAPYMAAHRFPDQEAEVRGVLANVKALVADGADPHSIAVVAREDEAYGPLMLAIAWEFDLPVRALYRVPIRNTNLGAWLRLLFRAIHEGGAYEAMFGVVGHALGPGLTSEQWIEARRTHPAGFSAWQALGVETQPLHWPEADTRAAWVERVRAVFSAFRTERRALRWSRELLAFNQLEEAFDSLATPAHESLTCEQFTQELDEALGLLSVPAQPGRGGIELHTPLSLYGSSYDHVFVLGMGEDQLPARVADDPILDFHERKRLAREGVALEDAVSAARREALSFWALLQVATSTLTFSFSDLVEGKEAIPSPYLSPLGLKLTPPPPRPAASREEARPIWINWEDPPEDSCLPQARQALQIERRREDTSAPDEYDGVIGLSLDPESRTFSASQLTALGQCAYKWFAGNVLGLAPPEEAEEDLSPSLRGKLYHKALELAMQAAMDAPDIRAKVLETLESAFLQAEIDEQIPLLPAWSARRQEHLELLRRAVMAPDFLLPSAAPI
ncbi:MAG TPA: PD-(D/E)XK nuclease family protein, partial [Stenomitos sp.]